jgi:FdhD protein
MITSVQALRANLKNDHIIESHTIEEHVAVEIPINILINNKHCITLLASPNGIKELGIGYILSEGIVKSFDECIRIEVSENNIKIDTRSDCDFRRSKILKLITTACISTTDYIKLLDRTKIFVSSKTSISPYEIVEIIRDLNGQCEVFKKTGGTHAAGLFDPSNGKALCIFEDVGRHNSIDKVIGFAALNSLDFSKLVLASTGRQPADMVFKAARVGIPIIVSVSGPINSGIILAEKTGVTLVCFARGKRLNVYTHSERIRF